MNNSQEIWNEFPLKHGRFNGKTKAHWEREAHKLVVETLLRSSEMDKRSVIGALAAKRLYELAKAEDPEVLAELEIQRDNCRESIGLILADCLP